MASVQHHPLYDLEKAAFEQDPTNAVLLALGNDNEGFAGLARNIIHYAPGSTPQQCDGFNRSTPGKRADEYMGKLAKVCIDGEGGLFVMAPPCGHRESVEMLSRLFQPFLQITGHVVLFFVTGRLHPGTLDSVLSWQQRVRSETSGSLDFAFFDQERGLSSGDAGFYHIVTKTGYFYSGFCTPGGWCTSFWSKDDPPKNMTVGRLSLNSYAINAADDQVRRWAIAEVKTVSPIIKNWARTTLFPTPSVLQYARAKEGIARC